MHTEIICSMRRLFIFMVLCITQMAVAQPAGNTTFRTLGIADGLRSNSVKNLLADSRGYLWIGTDQGINRYDGHQVKTRFVESSDPQLREVFSMDIRAMEEDAEGRIWIECKSGSYYLYDTRLAQFSASAEELLGEMGIRPNGRYKVKVGKRGTLWVLTERRIFRYDYNKKKLNTWEASLQLPGNWTDVVEEASDGLYLSAGHALWHWDSRSGELQHEPLPEQMEQAMGDVRVMTDTDGTLWVYSTCEEHICRYIVGGRRVREIIHLPHAKEASQNNAIRDILDDGRGNIWIATDHKGLFVYNKSTGIVTNMRHENDRLRSLTSDNVNCLAIDRDGTVWIGHLKTGISYVSEANSIMQLHTETCGDILAMAYDTKGRLWMATDGNGVYIEHTDGSILKTSLPNITVMTLLSDGQGGMWAGSYNKGLYHLTNEKQWKRYAADEGTFPSETVWALARDERGNIWTSSPIGQTVIFNPNDESTQIVTTDSGDDIHGNALRYDKTGCMYIASVYGLWSYNIKNGKCNVAFGNRKGTQQWLNQMVIDVTTDKQQQLMVLTHQDGITVFDQKQDTLYFIRRGNDIIKGMTKDHDGNSWFCTTSGNILSLHAKRKANGIEMVRRSFMSSLDMPQFYFNGDAMVCSPQGDILMGGTEGYMSIHPRQLMAVRREERNLVISEIALGDSLVNEQATMVNLSHDATFLTVKFFSGTLEGFHHMRYAYRLLGQMSDWVITDHNYVSFHALPPGNYTLQLCVCREDGTMSTPKELHINVKPPFYRTLPMYILYALVVLAVLYLQWRSMRKRQRQLMERQKMEQITEMKLQFFTNISHDLRTPLTLIISPLEQMIKKMEEGKTPDNLMAGLKSIAKNAQLLLREVSALLDFRRLDAGGETLNVQRCDIVDHLNSILVSFSDYAEERGINLSFEHDADSFLMDYDREKMNKVIYNLFSNALKFTPAGGSISLSFHQKPDYIVISIADTGKGISTSDKANIFKRFYQSASNDSSQTGSGIGLHIANEYIRLHHGTISVSDNMPVGSIFTITLPTDTEATLQNKKAEQGAAADRHTDENDRKTILIVDDNMDMLSFVSSCMKEDYLVHTAPDGAAAIDVLQRETIDLIVSDVMMPNIDGFELCRRVKTDINMSHIPIILLTARTTDVSRIEGLQLGADDYLTKPFNTEVLRLRVKKFIEWEQNNHRQFRQKMNIEPSEITITPLDEQFIKKAIALVEKNISDSEFSVETMAEEVGMARTTLYKKLMAITGQGPAEFIRTIRIKRGRALLETSQMQITEIAYTVGFTTVKSFTMNFKAVYGMTPTEFLRSDGSRKTKDQGHS